MREIKFRVWLGDRMDIVYTLFMDKLEVNTKGINGPVCHRDYTNSILMQYTGLKDKNGVDIYEGDILKASVYGGEFIGKVCYTGFAYEVLEKTDDPFEDSGYKPMTCIESNVLYEAMEGHSLFGNRIEVIGNIYENPELL